MVSCIILAECLILPAFVRAVSCIVVHIWLQPLICPNQSQFRWLIFGLVRGQWYHQNYWLGGWERHSKPGWGSYNALDLKNVYLLYNWLRVHFFEEVSCLSWTLSFSSPLRWAPHFNTKPANIASTHLMGRQSSLSAWGEVLVGTLLTEQDNHSQLPHWTPVTSGENSNQETVFRTSNTLYVWYFGNCLWLGFCIKAN